MVRAKILAQSKKSLVCLDHGGDNFCGGSGDLPESDCDSSAEHGPVQISGFPHRQCLRSSHTGHPHHALRSGNQGTHQKFRFKLTFSLVRILIIHEIIQVYRITYEAEKSNLIRTKN